MLSADVTSYLSATAYADRFFANKVVDAILWDPKRLVTTAPELDLARVVYHCRAASPGSPRWLVAVWRAVRAGLYGRVHGLRLVPSASPIATMAAPATRSA